MATPRLLALPALLLGLSVGGDQAVPNRLAGSAPSAATTRPYNHDRFVTLPVDIRRSFTAFVVSFDGADGERCLGVPEWVAYELRKSPPGIEEADDRPGRWSTDPELFRKRIAPADASYAGSGYSRGHMCMKSHAGRISAEADKETHTVLNACPQLQGMNNGVWKAIENLTSLPDQQEEELERAIFTLLWEDR